MKHYFVIEIGVLGALTAALLSIPDIGGPVIVSLIIVVAWVTLQLISSVAFCKAIQQGTIEVYPEPGGGKETYALAKGARPGWLVMRHIWTYALIRPRDPVVAESDDRRPGS
jgi:hypothetical protein